jgi:methyltransferase (TIGR00027 family)
MEEGQPSGTAMLAAMTRAAHLVQDGEPKVLRDDLALQLSGFENEAALRRTVEALLTEVAHHFDMESAQRLSQYARALITMRNRYAEDELSNAIGHGVGQYVILGAGLDSFAYRRRDLAGVLRVFEVDHPTTQQWKRARLGTLNVPLPDHLTFIPINFEQQTLKEGLQTGGYHAEAPVFFSWLGVTYYLTEEAIFETLRSVAAAAPGSEIVFEYGLSESLLDEESKRIWMMLQTTVAAQGEPMLSLFEPTTLAAQVKKLGFTQVWDFGPEEANARYFAGRTDGLHAPPYARLMRARVGSVS